MKHKSILLGAEICFAVRQMFLTFIKKGIGQPKILLKHFKDISGFLIKFSAMI